MWVLACYLAGYLIHSATYSTSTQCLYEAATFERFQPQAACLCRPNQPIRPK